MQGHAPAATARRGATPGRRSPASPTTRSNRLLTCCRGTGKRHEMPALIPPELFAAQPCGPGRMLTWSLEISWGRCCIVRRSTITSALNRPRICDGFQRFRQILRNGHIADFRDVLHIEAVGHPK